MRKGEDRAKASVQRLWSPPPPFRRAPGHIPEAHLGEGQCEPGAEGCRGWGRLARIGEGRVWRREGSLGPARLRGDPESTEEVSAAGGSPWARLSSRWSSWLCLQPRATPTPPEARALQPAAHSL